jgi:D-alanyl-D-alanine dipeptidase
MLLLLPLLLSACAPAPEENRTAALADTLSAPPMPVEAPAPPPPDYDTSRWTEFNLRDTGFHLDLRYAGDQNFVEEQMYDCGRCFLRPEAADALKRVQQALAGQGYDLLLLDCYRPRPVQQKLWDKVPDARYVTPPSRGSMHNRGLAVDLTLADSLGRELDMGTPYDFFGREAWSTYTQLPDSILQRRRLLRAAMEAEGFAGIRTEWWHFSYRRAKYPLDHWLWPCPGDE